LVARTLPLALRCLGAGGKPGEKKASESQPLVGRESLTGEVGVAFA